MTSISTTTPGAKLKRAEALRRAKNFVAEDQLRAARNLDRLISVWRRSEGFDLGRVLSSTGLAGTQDTDSTKRLYTYRLPENASEVRRKAIRKTPGKYFEIARAVARELEEPEEAILCQIFEGCSLGTDHAVDEDWETGNWDRLAELLERMSQAVIQDQGLANYWRKVRMTNGRYDVRRGIIRPDFNGLDLILDGYGHAGNVMCSDEMAPIPSIPLGRRRQAPPITGTVHLDTDERLDVELIFWLEVRLALGPVNAMDSIGPLIELRTVLEIRTEDGRTGTLDNPYTDTDRVQTMTLDGDILNISAIAPCDFDLVPDAEFRGFCDHSYFAWEEVSPALLRQLLEPGDPERTGPFHAINRSEGKWLADLPPNRFPQGSAAAVIHTDLLTGAIERELGQACADLVDRLEALRLDAADRIREAEAAALMRWTGPGATPQVPSETDQ